MVLESLKGQGEGRRTYMKFETPESWGGEMPWWLEPPQKDAARVAPSRWEDYAARNSEEFQRPLQPELAPRDAASRRAAHLMKREDLSRLALGRNKTRLLEFRGWPKRSHWAQTS